MSPRSEGSFTPFKHEIEQRGCVRRQNLEVAARRSLFLSFARLHSKSRPTKSPEVQVAPSSRGRHAVHDPSLGPETGWKLSRSRLFPPQALVIRSDFKAYAWFCLGFKTLLKPVFTYIARKTVPYAAGRCSTALLLSVSKGLEASRVGMRGPCLPEADVLAVLAQASSALGHLHTHRGAP